MRLLNPRIFIFVSYLSPLVSWLRFGLALFFLPPRSAFFQFVGFRQHRRPVSGQRVEITVSLVYNEVSAIGFQQFSTTEKLAQFARYFLTRFLLMVSAYIIIGFLIVSQKPR